MDIYFAEGIGGRGIGSYCRVWRDRPHVPALLPLLTFPPMHSPPSPLILVSIRPVPLTRTINPSEIPPPDRATKPQKLAIGALSNPRSGTGSSITPHKKSKPLIWKIAIRQLGLTCKPLPSDSRPSRYGNQIGLDPRSQIRTEKSIQFPKSSERETKGENERKQGFDIATQNKQLKSFGAGQFCQGRF